MEWWLVLLILWASFLILLMAGVPVAFSFLLINAIAAFIFIGGEVGLRQMILSIFDSISNFNLLPIPMFIIMGEVMFITGVAPEMMTTLDMWVGRIPGRLSILAVLGGTLFATMSGAAIAGVAMLGSVLVPEMEKRGYKKEMSLGPILGSGGLAVMIPPSALCIVLGALADISIGKLLIGIIIPGLLMACCYATYIIIRCILQPHLAPPYDVKGTSLAEKFRATLHDILPLAFIVFAVVGTIFFGIATPSESAAAGALVCFILAFLKGRLNWKSAKTSITNALQITVMIFMIFTGAIVYSQVLAYTGATRGLVSLVGELNWHPLGILAGMQCLLLLLGMFLEPVSIMMVTLPVFMPITRELGFDPVWFGAIMLLNMEMAVTTPPFGLGLFVMKGVAPSGTKMGDIYKAGLPFLGCDGFVMISMILFPQLVLWLPAMMR